MLIHLYYIVLLKKIQFLLTKIFPFLRKNDGKSKDIHILLANLIFAWENYYKKLF